MRILANLIQTVNDSQVAFTKSRPHLKQTLGKDHLKHRQLQIMILQSLFLKVFLLRLMMTLSSFMLWLSPMMSLKW